MEKYKMMFIKHDYDILCVRIVCSIKFSLYYFFFCWWIIASFVKYYN